MASTKNHENPAWYDRFRKCKVYFKPKVSFETKSELEEKMKDEKWTFFKEYK
jgi:hypothetical protein